MSAAGSGVSQIDRGAGRPDHVDQQRRVDRALLHPGVPVPARAELVPGVVAVHQVDPAGDGLHPVHDPGQVLAARERVAGVQAEPDLTRPAAASPIASHSRATASRPRAMAWSPPAVFSISIGTGRSVRSTALRQFVVALGHVRVGGDVRRRARSAPAAPIVGGRRQVLAEQLPARDADPVVGAGHVDPVRGVDERLHPAPRRATSRSAPRRRPGSCGLAQPCGSPRKNWTTGDSVASAAASGSSSCTCGPMLTMARD